MDKVFTEVAATFKTKLSLSHVQRVTRLYRRSLRELNSWAIDRDLFCREADKIRAQFDANKSLDPHGGLSQRLIREAEQKVYEFTHPDPYVKPYMPGGSKFMRNPPPPLRVCLNGESVHEGDENETCFVRSFNASHFYRVGHIPERHPSRVQHSVTGCAFDPGGLLPYHATDARMYELDLPPSKSFPTGADVCCSRGPKSCPSRFV